jgi:hypothetical protein
VSGPVTVALRRIEDLFADERCWARGFSGAPGKAHCLMGATMDPAVVPWRIRGPVADLLHETAAGAYQRGPVDVNDNLGLPAVRLVVATALDVAEAEGL